MNLYQVNVLKYEKQCKTLFRNICLCNKSIKTYISPINIKSIRKANESLWGAEHALPVMCLLKRKGITSEASMAKWQDLLNCMVGSWVFGVEYFVSLCLKLKQTNQPRSLVSGIHPIAWLWLEREQAEMFSPLHLHPARFLEIVPP